MRRPCAKAAGGCTSTGQWKPQAFPWQAPSRVVSRLPPVAGVAPASAMRATNMMSMRGTRRIPDAARPFEAGEGVQPQSGTGNIREGLAAGNAPQQRRTVARKRGEYGLGDGTFVITRDHLQ